ncbi:MAG: PQQ-binding-like beta-propeller repeat protein [Verrucomicrobia bacterium]|nr:PQQ-binding-like beta-propeller repeat protein [Verrucomicrobiota bacterium]
MIPKFPLFLTLLFGGLLAWLWATDHVFRSGGLMILIPLWLILFGLWWALHLRGARMKRLGVFILGVMAVIAAFKYLIRYDGSADGSAFPSLAWRWQKAEVLPELQNGPYGAAVPSATPAGVVDMPRFLGPKGDGVLPEPDWQTDWKAHPPREVWRIKVGDGWAGFALAGSRALTQEQRGEEEYVTCYDLATGTMLWAHADKTRFDEPMGGIGPRSTPTVDTAKNVVFTMGSKGLLNCLDVTTGKLYWSKDILKDSGTTKSPEWGKSAAPLIVGDNIVCSGGDNGTTLIAYKSKDGQLAWKAGDDGGSYSSPVLMTLAGREQILSVNSNSVTGHDPASGAVLWKFDWPGMFPKVCQPVQVTPERILVTTSYGLKSNLLEIKPAADGKMTVSSIWAASAPRTKFSSASVFGTHAYALDEGTFCCVDLATGERGWREGRYGFGQQIRLGESLMLVQAEKGFVALVKANPAKLEEVSRLEALNAKTWNPPTLAGRWLLLRNDREAVCFELPAK